MSPTSIAELAQNVPTTSTKTNVLIYLWHIKHIELPTIIHFAKKINTDQLSWHSVMRYCICDIPLMFPEQISAYQKLNLAMQEAETYVFTL